jgi:hypothetical protein
MARVEISRMRCRRARVSGFIRLSLVHTGLDIRTEQYIDNVYRD